MNSMRFAAFLMLATCLPGVPASAAEDAAVPPGWLMMVRTENADPSQEAAFNQWYDEIDIPDVLKVPGYLRARRGLASPDGPRAAGEGRYVALYDIDSRDIERTIESMNQLARDMPKQGRATPLLRVTERIYYRAAGAPRNGTLAGGGGKSFLVLHRFGCAADADTATFDAWYDARVVAAVLAVLGVQRARRYVLHRVRMDDPVPVPQYLTVYEVAAADAVAAAAALETALRGALDGGAVAAAFVPGDANVFRLIKDVVRPAAP
ncbi:MAG: hypothetical protein ACKPE6_04680 [Gammaproteobacteria bacterium]